MNRAKLIGACLAAALLLPVAGFAADGKTREFVKDSVITTKIKADFVKDKTVSALHIKVDTDAKGVVMLSGKAKSQVEADRAAQIARGVEGVTEVNNQIIVVADR